MLEDFVSQYKLGELKKLCAEISERYRKGVSPFFQKKEHRLAYLVTRFPATFAAIAKVLEEIRDLNPHSIADLGAGPGTGYLAASSIFPHLKKALLVECDDVFIEIGKKMVSSDVLWMKKDLRQLEEIGSFDITLFSYSLGEIPEKEWFSILENVWGNTTLALIIIEPGTPLGFSRLRKMRTLLISLGGSVRAPCPHSLECPIQSPDWCHFSARFARTSLHRLVKEGSLGFEDEKFSYVIMTKDRIKGCKERILRHPQKHPGYVTFSLCTQEGLKSTTVTKKEKERYKQVKKLEWGDRLCSTDR